MNELDKSYQFVTLSLCVVRILSSIHIVQPINDKMEIKINKIAIVILMSHWMLNDYFI